MIGIIGGSGLQQIEGLRINREVAPQTPYGAASASLVCGDLADAPIVFLARHGRDHTLPPHRINYRANIHALKDVGVTRIIAVAAVGGITPAMRPGRIAFPSQIVDYTHGRAHTFFDGEHGAVTHIDFTDPYCEDTRRVLIDAAQDIRLNAASDGVYGATQGPRLESAAEIDRMERDGCDVVGMTGMPEAALAREAAIPYVCCAIVANWAAGRGDGPITMEAINTILESGMRDVQRLLTVVLPRLSRERPGPAA